MNKKCDFKIRVNATVALQTSVLESVLVLSLLRGNIFHNLPAVFIVVLSNLPLTD